MKYIYIHIYTALELRTQPLMQACVFTQAGQNPMSPGTVGAPLLLALNQFLAMLLTCVLFCIHLLRAYFQCNSSLLFPVPLSPSVCSSRRALCTQLNNTLGKPSKAPCFQLFCEQFKSQLMYRTNPFSPSLFLSA